VRAWFVPAAGLLGGFAAGCATIAGLDLLEKVDCVVCDAGSILDAGGSYKDVVPPVDAGPTHAIRGTVTGLVGGGLVLENNGSDDLAIAADGPFVFMDRVSERMPYSVTVLQQPSNQTCAVVRGSGVVGTADVTNVQVTCAAKTFTIGGAVSGLMGSGLVLQNNGADNLPIAANGPFSFASGVTNGASYAVTVLTQPSNPSQACVVSSGTGAVAAANVTGVVVNCTSGSFTVGGSVTGLVGTGLVVQNNGANDLAIAANGTFSFATPVQAGSPYAVTVKTQPSDFEQTCAVTNGTGSIGAANVSNVQIACGAVKAIAVSGPGGQIADGRGSCTTVMPGPPRTSDITIATDHFMINDVTVTLTDLNHTFGGDLIATLQHVESRTSVDLFRRVEMAPNLECGSRGVFGGTYRFSDSFTGDLWSFPAMTASLPPGDYFASTTSGTKSLLTGASGFRGRGVAGTWRLTITDAVMGDTGSLGGWTLRLTP
jgi:hypothetical protein